MNESNYSYLTQTLIENSGWAMNLPICVIFCACAALLFSIIAFILAPTYSKGKHPGAKSAGTFFSVFGLVLGIIALIGFIFFAVLILIYSGKPYYSMGTEEVRFFNGIVFAPLCLGLPIEWLIADADGTIKAIIIYGVALFIPAIISFIARGVSYSAKKKFKRARASMNPAAAVQGQAYPTQNPYAQPQYAPQQAVQPQYAPQQAVQPQYAPQQTVQPQYAPQQAVQPQYAPQQTVQPQYAPQQTVQPQYAPQQTVQPQYAPQQTVQPQYAPQQAVQPQYAPQEAVQPQYAPQENVEHHEISESDANELLENTGSDFVGESTEAASASEQPVGSAVISESPAEQTEESAKRFCTNCGFELVPEAMFCMKCGTKA